MGNITICGSPHELWRVSGDLDYWRGPRYRMESLPRRVSRLLLYRPRCLLGQATFFQRVFSGHVFLCEYMRHSQAMCRRSVSNQETLSVHV